MTHNSVKNLIQLWVGSTLLLYSSEISQVQNLCTCTVMSCWSYFLVHAPCSTARHVGPLFYFIFFLSGKSPAGPMCGITAQDPSRAGSQKRKQLSDNKLLFCDQTIVFLRSGWGSWECVKNDTQIPTCPCIYIYVSLWSHTCTDGISKSHVEPLLASGSKPAIFYTSECQIIQCTQSQNQEKQTDYPAIDKHSRSSPQ